MRKFISLIFIILCVSVTTYGHGLMPTTTGTTPSSPSCSVYLGTVHKVESFDIVINEDTSHPRPVNVNKPLNGYGYPQKLEDTLYKVRKVLDTAKELKFIAKSKHEHLLDDLEELSKELDKKAQNETFMAIIEKWSLFAETLETQIQSFQALSETQQKLYFEKMKLPVAFMTSHFITFLETKHLKFNYLRMHTVLKYMTELDSKADLVLYLYEFEKQVLKFFSKKEFINCNA